ncbi:ParB/RepB/Spo0J family partition protein [Acinetobacter johnsonii]|jgi:ParB-like chromosome segregation protein Spo0J|uniref:ParB/RepB/Spo0J family partition protein n=1 Tax=Acinetobacter johnsonii TaxID=40214 RepID=UPI00244973D1|nr:ParB/RepB/Spo0J family partition protein [Acinetobacter johnsonii]MDH2045677.1 ParB/RepB/Spo0J family partition protein [Acinetobacter johnsonii]
MTFTNLQLDPKLLKPNPWNSNIVSPTNEAKLEESIKRFGMFKPIIVRELPNGDYQILGGEHRAAAAERVGLTSIPVINLGKIPDKKAKEIGLVDNGRFGEDDSMKLLELIKEIGGPSEIIDFMPYSQSDLDEVFNSSIIALDDLDSLADMDDDIHLPETKSAPSHQVMRFRIANDDIDAVTKVIERIIKTEGFTESDSLTNAGDALVHLAKQYL